MGDTNTYKFKLNLYFSDIDQSSEEGRLEIDRAKAEALAKFDKFCFQNSIKITKDYIFKGGNDNTGLNENFTTEIQTAMSKNDLETALENLKNSIDYCEFIIFKD